MGSYAPQLEAWEDENVAAFTDVVRTWSDKWEVEDMCHSKLEDAKVSAFL